MEASASSPKKKKARALLTYFSPQNKNQAKAVDPSIAALTSYECSTTTTSNLTSPPVSLPDGKNDTDTNLTKSKKVERKFQSSWLKKHSWLEYDSDNKFMTCSICIKHKKDSVFTTKNTNFKTTTLVRHADSKEHKDAVQADLLSRQYVKVLVW